MKTKVSLPFQEDTMEARKLLDNRTNFDSSLTTRKILFLLHKKDPSVRHVDIKIDSEDETDDNIVLLPQFGRAIAKSTDLTSLHLFMARGPNTEEENSRINGFLQSESNHVKRFLDEIRENRCIQNFRLEISTPDNEDHDRRFKEVLENLNSFVEKNDELKSIDITSSCLMDDSSVIASMSNAMRNRSRPIEQITLRRIGRIPAGAMMLDLSCVYDPVIPPKKIILEGNGVGNWGCSILSSLMRYKQNELEEITMIDEGISDDGLEIIAIALCIQKIHLKKLAIEANSDLGSEGLIHFIDKFSSIPESLPDNLSFSKNSFGHDGLKKLGKFLAGRSHPLESLHLNGPGMSDDHLEDFFEVLETNPIATPEMLHVSRLYIGVTELLRKQNCPLKRLHIDTMDDDEASRLARSLKNNCTLIEIVVYDDTMFLYGYGWRNIASFLCNKRDITATYNDSNHTLAKFDAKRTTRRGSIRQPLIVRSYLAMNSLSNKKVVAKMKVVECHFARNFILDQFTEMKPSVVVEVLSFVNQGYCAGEENGWTPNRGFFDDEIAYNNNMTLHFLMLRGIPGVLVGAGF